MPTCTAEYDSAESKGGDVEARLAAALDDATTFREFLAELTRLTGTNTFDRLPRFRIGNQWFDGVHHLTVGPWRGVFLTSPSTRQVYGMLFTRSPHMVQQSDFDEILARSRELAKAAAPKSPS